MDVVDHHAKWARAHLRSAGTLSDAELRLIAEQAGHPWQRTFTIARTLGFLLILAYRDRLVFQFLGQEVPDWQGYLLLILVAGVYGAA